MNSAYGDIPDAMQSHSGLVAPATFWTASGESRARNCNGCGTEGWKGALVPETVWGLRISRACDIHDWMYAEGRTEADRHYADMLFLNNMIALIDQASQESWLGWLLKLLRQRRAFTYYQAVSSSSAGLSAFRMANLR